MQNRASIPDKAYFSIGEVSEMFAVRPHVLRYWEQEFSQLRPAKRGGNRRYYRPPELQVVREIRRLLYEEGLTIPGARAKLIQLSSGTPVSGESGHRTGHTSQNALTETPFDGESSALGIVRRELRALRSLLITEVERKDAREDANG